ncbi:STE family protein kinase [Tritrichomonas foetus]|uniref:STE family protein kinase n=1 Tax=Tritrichomonas foetus TaxID=1144522 RepID=A0A1J4K222_9EUKA|nr:STE family protein kinase [Tritrichomonas foetus]|eukprot:OHT05010.1 STE family protein kinase [Tritrichomonas foetus]
MSNFPLDSSKYELLHLIGVGTYSRVYEARCLTNNKILAIKQINLEEFPLPFETIQRQTAFWSKCVHPNVVEYYGSFIDGPVLWILNEYMGAGSLKDIIKFGYNSGFKDEALIASLLSQVVAGIKFFHDNHEIHRDIRSNNILINSKGVAKLGDFGLATSLVKGGTRQGSTLSLFGEECYMAPEVLRNENGYSEKTDIWSLGLTSIEFATGKMPYSGMKFMESLVQIIDHEPPTLPDNKEFSAAYKDFVKQCLMSNPLKRATAAELSAHRFIKGAKGNDYVKKTLIQHLSPLYEIFEHLHGVVGDEPPKPKGPPTPQMVFEFPADDSPSQTQAEAHSEAHSQSHSQDKEHHLQRPHASVGPASEKIKDKDVQKVGRFKVTRTTDSLNIDVQTHQKQMNEMAVKESKPMSPEEQQHRIEALANEISSLTAELHRLETENGHLKERMDDLAATVAKMQKKK